MHGLHVYACGVASVKAGTRLGRYCCTSPPSPSVPSPVIDRFSLVDLDGKVQKLGQLTEPTLPDGSGGGLYHLTMDTTRFPSGEG